MRAVKAPKALTFEKWLEMHYGYKGSDEEVEKEIIYRNARLVDEIFEEEWCMSYGHAKRTVIKQFQEEYVADSTNEGFKKLTEGFWWE